MIKRYLIDRSEYYEKLPLELSISSIFREKIEEELKYIITSNDNTTGTIVREGSTGFVVLGQTQCAKIRKSNLDEFSKKIFANDVINNHKLESDIRSQLGLPQSVAVIPSRNCIVNQLIKGQLFKEQSLDEHFKSIELLIALTKKYIENSYYDDDYTPSNFIFSNYQCYNIDLGNIHKLNGMSWNPYNNDPNFNMIERLLYKNVMVSIVRMIRKEISDGLSLYHHFYNCLEKMKFPNEHEIYKKMHLRLYNKNPETKFIVDKYLSNKIILMENEADNYQGSKNNIRIEECIGLRENFGAEHLSMLKQIYGVNYND